MSDFEGGGGFDGGFIADSEPDSFAFTAVTEAETSTVYRATAQLTGMDDGAYVTQKNGELSVDGGLTWTTDTVNYVMGFTWVRASLTSSTAYSTETSKLVTVNGISGTFRVTTASAASFVPSDPTSDEYYHYIEGRMREFFASAPPVLRSIQTLEIRHSGMATVHYFWREPYNGQITLENESVVAVRGLNMEIRIAGNEEHLDQQFDIAIDTTDADDEFRTALDQIPISTTERVQVIYREYLSDDLTTPQIIARLQVENIVYKQGVAKLSAVSPRLNITRTGALYSYRDFPTLRGFL